MFLGRYFVFVSGSVVMLDFSHRHWSSPTLPIASAVGGWIVVPGKCPLSIGTMSSLCWFVVHRLVVSGRSVRWTTPGLTYRCGQIGFVCWDLVLCSRLRVLVHVTHLSLQTNYSVPIDWLCSWSGCREFSCFHGTVSPLCSLLCPTFPLPWLSISGYWSLRQILSRTGPVWLVVWVFQSVTLVVTLHHPNKQLRQTCGYCYWLGFPSGCTQEHTIEGPYISRRAASLEGILAALSS